ncbi:hypothetical protein DM02DRAFT_517644 [Periconia macrospinosa]|uniref:NACHT domain-containing protein n=1 Tax=Periconia macrospinosa TaxID=97972 RepID=A0A2V1E3S9_9PLEO|nr:hypothetical protein DM02DRAFT_517644 [Periconia macrospinosa]
MVLSRVDLPQHCAPRNEVENIRSLLESPPDVQLDALKRIIKEQKRERLLVVIDGLDAPGLSGKVQRGKEHRHRFFEQIKDFVNDLENYKAKVKALLTGEPVVDASSRTQHWICINYDEERTECLSSLLFDNSRYENISSGHEGSFEWIWTHAEFSDWLMASKSRLIYVQGKPGSGKSTLTKYVSESLLERENIAETAIVAKYFYSDREGESQRSHYHMLRSLLHDLLLQDENFFYSGFQKEYRNHLRPDSGMKRKYESLKRVLKSFKIYQASKPVYLIIDAVDESDQDDRRDILDLLLDLHEGPSERSTIKTFIASRPVGQLDSTSHNFIRLQDWTRGDICACAISFLDRLRLPDPTFYRSKALTFIVDRAQGVFLWVHLVGKDLLRNFDDGQSTQNVLEYLEELPQELDDYYKLMLQKICKNERNIADSRMLLQFVLFAKRPLTVDELLHALGARNTPDTGQLPLDAEFHLRVPTSKRILVCGGDFLEVKSNDERDICQVMHQTVRDYFFRPNSQAKQFILEKIDQDAHISIAMICIRYLTVVVANMNETKGLPPFSEWTDTQFAVCAQRLQQWPLASYALHHLAGK